MAPAATKAQVHWDRNSAANALNLLAQGDHLTQLKDNYRRDCMGFLQTIEEFKKNPTEWDKIKKFVGTLPEMTAAKLEEKVRAVEEILELLGGPITEKA